MRPFYHEEAITLNDYFEIISDYFNSKENNQFKIIISHFKILS